LGFGEIATVLRVYLKDSSRSCFYIWIAVELAATQEFRPAQNSRGQLKQPRKGAFRMNLKLTIVLFTSLLVIASCSTSTTQTPDNGSQTAVGTSAPLSTATTPVAQQSVPPAIADAPVVKLRVDACALLTSKEIESVQGEAIRETKLTGQSTGGFSVSQCFFTLPTFTNSVSLLVAQKGEGAPARDPKEFWRDAFHEKKARERDEDPNQKRSEGEEERETPPQMVPGIGDEAYWTGSRVGGALYVLKGSSYVQISIGGPSDQATKIKRSKALAEKAIARL
jgi:hypothetical protein